MRDGSGWQQGRGGLKDTSPCVGPTGAGGPWDMGPMSSLHMVKTDLLPWHCNEVAGQGLRPLCPGWERVASCLG